jgi:hypothetical protein
VVQAYVSQWRKVLERTPASVVGRERLVTSGAGYLLRTDSDANDLRTFLDRLRAGQAALATRDPRVAMEHLRAAVGLWRGPPVADLAELPFYAASAARLAQLRMRAVEDWALAGLATGEDAGIIDALTAARADEPLRERLTELLMWALYAEDVRPRRSRRTSRPAGDWPTTLVSTPGPLCGRCTPGCSGRTRASRRPDPAGGSRATRGERRLLRAGRRLGRGGTASR